MTQQETIYTSTSLSLIFDERLTLGAHGVLCFINIKSSTFTLSELVSCGTDDSEKVMSYIQELIDFGYAKELSVEGGEK